MKLGILFFSATLCCAKMYEHAAYGLSIEYPDLWRILIHKEKSYTKGGPLCSFFPYEQEIVVNVTTRPKKEGELEHFRSEKGKEKLRMALLSEYNHSRPGILMRGFSLVNDEKGPGFCAFFNWKSKGKPYAAYQRGFLSVLQYFVLTVRGPIGQRERMEKLLEKMEIAFPKVSFQTKWRRL